jgi:hypothetical protein
MATRFMDERTRDTARSAEAIENALSDVQGEYRRLLGDAEAGRISARDYSDRFAGLRRQQRALEQKAEAIGRAAELVRTIEADPEAWADQTFYGKYPRLRPLFSF